MVSITSPVNFSCIAFSLDLNNNNNNKNHTAVSFGIVLSSPPLPPSLESKRVPSWNTVVHLFNVNKIMTVPRLYKNKERVSSKRSLFESVFVDNSLSGSWPSS